jgi:hypothetical protein
MVGSIVEADAVLLLALAHDLELTVLDGAIEIVLGQADVRDLVFIRTNRLYRRFLSVKTYFYIRLVLYCAASNEGV